MSNLIEIAQLKKRENLIMSNLIEIAQLKKGEFNYEQFNRNCSTKKRRVYL